MDAKPELRRKTVGTGDARRRHTLSDKENLFGRMSTCDSDNTERDAVAAKYSKPTYGLPPGSNSQTTTSQRIPGGPIPCTGERGVPGRRVGVKVMAAMFKDQWQRKGALLPGQAGENCSYISPRYSQLSSGNSTQASKWGTFGEEETLSQKPTWSPEQPSTSSKASSTNSNQYERPKNAILGALATDEVAEDEAEVEEQDQDSTAQAPVGGLGQSSTTLKDANANDSDGSPVRKHSATSLHRQMRSLRRQLDAKTEEISQLRQQLEAKGTSNTGSALQMWRGRAEAAERRVQAFERFAERLKGIIIKAAEVECPGELEGQSG
ncbi:hypothetical protein ACRE_055830 [Hapsidospora chrysogenum ATCC 11550]|uniref:Uncharacterized protein n=1 Tax=Hapsidospora chrysogenum (strain ATCC 11550 / CBS 779.69 / DSM 880 / IAM 14645 / JCM 23072 / IMI 49137) TaxID=857340 RepID=A0A086T2S9_HAPC1|nr:hypothetical protein ACRE_055830 [Hapsidospora chrysogenum ATCC 11550]